MEKRIKLSLDKNWSFHYGDLPERKLTTHDEIYGAAKAGAKDGPAGASFDASEWRVLDLPHDYLIEQGNDKNSAADWGYKPKNNAWYRKVFTLDEQYRGKRIIIEFEGVATEAEVYFNGSLAKRNFSGYTGFSLDLTDRVKFGEENVLAVHVNGKSFEGWWYEGAGIYRSAWLHVIPEIRFTEEPYIICDKLENNRWRVSVSGAISAKGAENGNFSVKKIIRDIKGSTVLEFDGASAEINDPVLWDIENPYLYTLTSELYADGKLADSVTSEFGFRTIEADPEKGFFLNGKPLKIYGTCNHQDFGGIGTAVPESIWRYKIMRLKSMGCNAYRSAHGMASDALVKACDRLGMLLMDENRSFETSEEVLEQLRTMVKRDRNHPSVVFYSIFNEEPIAGTEQGRNMALHMIDEIRRLDRTRFITGAMNVGLMEDCGAAGVFDVVGINYQPQLYDELHKKYPKLPIVATETVSAYQTRGCTVTDEEKHTFSCYDEDVAFWGNSIRETWQEVNSREFVMGSFVWTGFDYLGEPSPHTYPSVSSFFGMMDTCGFEKGGYYLSKAIFSKVPYAEILPDSWNFSEGENVKVMCCTNCEQAELFLNGKSCGKHRIDKFKQHMWNVVFEAGELKLVGYNGGKEVVSAVRKTALQPSRLVLAPCFDCFDEKTEAVPVMVYLLDEKGTVIPDAADKIKFSVSGGKILGTANGDPNCHQPFNGKTRDLFAGKAMVIVSAEENSEGVVLKAKMDGLKQVSITISVKARPGTAYIC